MIFTMNITNAEYQICMTPFNCGASIILFAGEPNFTQTFLNHIKFVHVHTVVCNPHGQNDLALNSINLFYSCVVVM